MVVDHITTTLGMEDEYIGDRKENIGFKKHKEL